MGLVSGQGAARAVESHLLQHLPVSRRRDHEVPAERREVLHLAAEREQGNAQAGGHARGVAPKNLEGIVLDDTKAEFTGNWKTSSSVGKFVGFGYRHEGNTRDGKATARFAPKLPKAGRYEVRLAYAFHSNRATNVRVDVQHARGSETFTVNQKQAPPEGELFLPLGTFHLEPGKPAAVVISNEGVDGYVIVDAVQWLPVDE